MQFRQLVEKKSEHINLSLMLIALHFSIWLDLISPISRAFLLVHLGLFLIWQPLHERHKKFKKTGAFALILVILAIVYWISWWLISLWIVLLIGLVGGRVFTDRIQRSVYTLVMILLLFELLIISVPELFSVDANITISGFTEYFIPLLAILILFFPPPQSSDETTRVDLLQSITSALLAGILSLGTLVIFYHLKTDYYVALIQTLIAVGIFMIIISWLVSPHSGFSGLSQLWTRSLLNIGTPFEQWLIELSELGDKHQLPDDFIKEAMKKLVTLPWVSGVSCTINQQEAIYGTRTKHEINRKIRNNNVKLYTHFSIGGALLLHCNLLIQLIENFYIAKVNERELAKQTHLQAIYETGARITHDIKNLLQSMHMMKSVLEYESDNTSPESVRIIKKQMPYFIKRLESAKNKLQAPEKAVSENEYLSDWWQNIQLVYHSNNIKFTENILMDKLIPSELFNNVAENLIENAIAKRQSDQSIDISMHINSDKNSVELMIIDNGKAIEDDIVSRLFSGPIESNNGLGIGLYQAGKLASYYGYHLELEYNDPGKVGFRLFTKSSG